MTTPTAKTAAKPAATKTTAARTATRPAARPAARVAVKPVAKPAAVAVEVVAPTYDFKKPYKMLTGVDDSSFCDKVSAHLNAGYTLVGGATMTTVGGKVFVGQAVTKASNIVKPKPKAKAKKKK